MLVGGKVVPASLATAMVGSLRKPGRLKAVLAVLATCPLLGTIVCEWDCKGVEGLGTRGSNPAAGWLGVLRACLYSMRCSEGCHCEMYVLGFVVHFISAWL